MIDIRPLEHHLKILRRWRWGLVPMFGMNVFFAAMYIVQEADNPLQSLAIVVNIIAAVVGWDSVQGNFKIEQHMRAAIERAREFNRLYR